MLAARIAKPKRFESGILPGASVPALSQYLSHGSHGANYLEEVTQRWH
jgi:hypothetical protein